MAHTLNLFAFELGVEKKAKKDFFDEC